VTLSDRSMVRCNVRAGAHAIGAVAVVPQTGSEVPLRESKECDEQTRVHRQCLERATPSSSDGKTQPVGARTPEQGSRVGGMSVRQPCVRNSGAATDGSGRIHFTPVILPNLLPVLYLKASRWAMGLARQAGCRLVSLAIGHLKRSGTTSMRSGRSAICGPVSGPYVAGRNLSGCGYAPNGLCISSASL
jgi:hypothetical protein